MLFPLLIALLQGPQIPAPSGYVNDFAGVLPGDARRTLEAISEDVRSKSRGEIVVVTLRDLEGRQPYEVGLRIGREWMVGARAAIGAAERNTGTIVLIVPKETSSDGRGHCFVATGSGTEGFVTDASAGDACREAIPLFQAQRYGDATVMVAYRIAQRYASEFGFQLDSSVVAAAPRRPSGDGPPSSGGISPALIIALIVIVMLFSNRGRRGRRRTGCLPFLPIILPHGGRHRGGWGGGGFGGFGGGGGGFGGFGGGGGFSGGGGGASW